MRFETTLRQPASHFSKDDLRDQRRAFESQALLRCLAESRSDRSASFRALEMLSRRAARVSSMFANEPFEALVMPGRVLNESFTKLTYVRAVVLQLATNGKPNPALRLARQ